jgi:uncharacterized membrane protein
LRRTRAKCERVNELQRSRWQLGVLIFCIASIIFVFVMVFVMAMSQE